MAWTKGICGICPAGCWVEVDVQDGRLAGIRADDSHPLGMICRRGQHAPAIVYAASRLRHPLRRSGPKGTFEFTRISWDEALDAVAARLQEIKAESGPEAAAIYTGRGSFELSLCDIFQPKGVAVSSASSLLFRYGSPNTMGVGALCYVSFAMIAPHVTMGRMLIDLFTDMEQADLLIVWGANPATDSPPLDMYRLEAAARRGAAVVVIDPRRTETVTRTAAEWVPIRPGTDGALALALTQVLVEEDLLDHAFAEAWCHGFDEYVRYVQHFTPEVAEATTGVPAGTIRTLARRLARARGACPVMYTGLEYSNSGIQAIRAVLTLFALAGHLDVPGGIGLAMPGSHFPVNRSCHVANPDVQRAVARDRFPIYSLYRGEGHASGLVTSVLEGRPYRIRALIIHGASLLTSWPATPVWRETLSKLDFVVSIDRQLTADAAYADIVLPATTMFEIESYMVYGPIFRLREQLIEPVGEARNDYRIMTELARRLGYGDQYPGAGDELVRFVLQGSGYTPEDVRRAGGWVRVAQPLMEYRKWQKGRLRADGKPGFETPTGKFEIRSTVLEEFGYEGLPKYTEPVEGPIARPDLARSFPLVFNSGARPHTNFRSQSHDIPGLLRDHPEPTVEINTADAAARGIASGDLVEVRTPRGAVPFRAVVTDGLVQGAIECTMGGGTPVGPRPWQEWNVNELTDLDNVDEISGFPVYKALLGDVVRKEAGTVGPGAGTAAAATCGPRLFEPVARPEVSRRAVYLDNNATTEVAAAVREAMLPYLDAASGNPSSLHRRGREAREAIETARRQVAQLVTVRPRRVVFTGGGSEANNLAIKGIAFAAECRRGHIVTSAVEHPSVLATCRFLERQGYRVTYLGVDSDGLVDPRDLERELAADTVLVSIMLANNEVGTIQPIAELAAVAHARGAVFHTDAVQAAGKIPVDAEALGIDLMTVAAHKFHGPKGVGALYVRSGVTLEPLVHGGGQEHGARAGTENVPGIVGMGRAAELALEATARADDVGALRDRLEAGIRRLVPGARLNGHRTRRLPNTLNLTLPGLRGESLVIALDQHGIALSSGSACKTGSPEPTHVLLAMGRSPEEAHCALRFSLSARTSAEEVDLAVAALGRVLEEMETTVRFLPCK
jgi:cysteine desulfurase NifS